jgi:hypothetical protein
VGFDEVFAALAPSMITNAAGFISDFAPVFAGLVGIAFAGYALMVVRRFIS